MSNLSDNEFDEFDKLLCDAVAGDANAQEKLADVLAKQGLLATSLHWYTLSAENGNSSASTKVGACYNSGSGVAVDYKKSLAWFRKAVEQNSNNAMAINFIGLHYYHGYGVEQDDEKATGHFMMAAGLGMVDSIHNLGMVCLKKGESGVGSMSDIEEALYWFDLGATLGFEPSISMAKFERSIPINRRLAKRHDSVSETDTIELRDKSWMN